MPPFQYTAKNGQGQLVTGTVDADGSGQVVQKLQAMGLFPVKIGAGGGAAGAAGGGKAGVAKSAAGGQSAAGVAPAARKAAGKRVPINDLATFNRQLADLLSSGIPLVKALGVIENQTSSENLRAIIATINADVTGGDSLAVAMSKHPRVFSKLYCAMVKAGETGGLLDSVLQRLADFSEGAADTRSKVKSALAYPAVMVLAGSGAVITLLTVVMPKILKIFTELNQTLPVPTQILIAISDALIGYWYLFVGGAGLVGLGLWQAGRTPEGRRIIDGAVLKIPVLGTLILKQEVANFARTLGSLLQNGVSILPALEITQDVLTNRVVADEVAKIPENVTQGEGVAAPLRKSTVFPPVVVNMMAIGEETGRLDDVLQKIARSYDVEVERATKTLTSLIEPIIILGMGVIVGFIVIAMLLPIFTIDPSATQ